MTWLRITKIVKDKDAFFPDHLSMLYTALHSCAKNVVLVVEKRRDTPVQLYLGVRDYEGILRQSGETLKGSLPGFLPGLQVQSAPGPQADDRAQFVASCSGVASLRDDKKQHFIQDLERLLDATDTIPSFTAYFVADNVPDALAEQMIGAFATLHTQLQPLAEEQLTYNESMTQTVSRSLTESLSQSITDTLSQTVTRTEGTSSSLATAHTEGTSKTKGHSVGAMAGGCFFGFMIGGSYSHNWSNTTNESDTVTDTQGTSRSNAQADGSSQARGQVTGRSTQSGDSQASTQGTSRQLTLRNRAVKHALDTLDKQIDRLTQGRPFGLWSVATYFTAPTATTALKLANIYRGTVVGENSGLQHCAINVWEREASAQIMPYLKDAANPRFMYRCINVSAGSVVTSEELAIHLSLPQHSVPGILVREEKTFGRNVAVEGDQAQKGAQLRLGCVRHLGQDYPSQEVSLSVTDLARHTFITGATGSGKSNTVYSLIDGLLQHGIKVMVVEPAKGEYRHVFAGRGFKVYGTNPDLTPLLRINPFAFPRGIRVDEHVERLVEIFNVCWPMYAAMPAVLKDSILRAYEACGWDLRRSRSAYPGLFPTFADVLVQLRQVIGESAYSADTRGDYIGALETRLRSLTNGIYSQIFIAVEALTPEDLYDDNVIIDLSRLGSAETRSMIMGMMVLGLSEHRMAQADGRLNQPLQHVTVLEEAHNLLRRTSKEQSQEGANMQGKSVEMIATAIAEVRTYGEGFVIVDQSPTSVDEAAIKNTNTKIVMSLYDEDDRRVASGALGLDDEHKAEISRLPTGVALVYQNQWQQPVLTHIDRYETRNETSVRNNRPLIAQDTSEVGPSLDLIRVIVGLKPLKESPESLRRAVTRATMPSWAKYQALQMIDKPAFTPDGKVLWHYLGLGAEIEQVLRHNADNPAAIVPALDEELRQRLQMDDGQLRRHCLAALMNVVAAQSPELHDLCVRSVKG